MSHNLSRRAFLGTVASSAAALALPVDARGRPDWLNQLAANAFGIRKDLIADLPSTLTRLKKDGFNRLELVSFRGWANHPFGSFAPLAGMTGEQVGAALSGAGLKATSSHVLPEEVSPDALARTAAWMHPIGVDTLIMAGLPIGEGDNNGQSAAMLRALDSVNETGRRIRQQGFQLMLHGDFALWQSYGSGRYFDEFVQRVDPALCRLQLDLGACLQMGVDPLAVIADHAPHLGSVHLRDGKPPFNPKIYLPSAALGEGAAPIPAIVRSALRAQITDFVLEMVMRPEGGELDALARSRAYLEQLAAERSK